MFKWRNWLIHNVKVVLIQLLENLCYQKNISSLGMVGSQIYSYDITVFDDGCSIPSIFSQLTVEELEVNQEMV